MEIMVSVIVPVYNVEAYIDQCLESLVNQTYKNKEIIVINDGSTDNSGDICKKWAEKEKLIYLSKKNEGLGATRNLGVSIAQGDYVLFVDSDDWIATDTLERMVDYITGELPDVIAFSRYFEFNDKTKETKEIRQNELIGTEPVYDERRRRMYLLYGLVVMWGKLFRREFLLSNRIKMPSIPHEDNAVFPEIIFCANRIHFFESPLYYYRLGRKGSILSDHSHYVYLPDACENFLKYFYERDMLRSHYAGIKQYVETRLKWAYEQLCQSERNRDQKLEFVNKSVRLRKKYFKDKKAFWEYKFALLGSFGSRWVTHSLSADIEQLTYHMPFSSVVAQMTQGNKNDYEIYNENEFRVAKIKDDIRGALCSVLTDNRNQIDFFFLDFLEERYDIAELDDGNYVTLSEAFTDSLFGELRIKKILKSGSEEHFQIWKNKCRQLAELLIARFEYSQIILIKSRLTIKYMEKDKLLEYPEKASLEEKNLLIERMENYFLSLMKKPIQTYVYPDELYTVDNFRMGIDPQYSGDVFYRKMAAEICINFDCVKIYI